MARNVTSFEKKCICGAVRIDGAWRNSFFIRGLPETKKLKVEKCPDCLREKIPHGNHLSFVLD